MAKYLVQAMSSGVKKKITYYRAQSAHPSHVETGAFTQAAILSYASTAGVAQAAVEKGAFQSNQGVPAFGTQI